jgi:hypothetical protein
MALLKRAGVLILVTLLVLSLAGSVAGAKKKHKNKARKWDSQVTLTHPSSTQFTGVVSSKLDACRDARLVGVYYTDPVTGQTQPISVQRTNSKGHYQVTLSAPAYGGTYQTQLIAQRIRAMKAPQICKGAESAPVVADAPPA